MNIKNTQWTKEEIDFIYDNYQTMNCISIGEKLNRLPKSIQTICKQLNIKLAEPDINFKINRLTIKEKFNIDKFGENVTMAKCKCECGGFITVKLNNLVNGTVKSCGCIKKEINRKRMIERNTSHGHSHTKLYQIYATMKTRCYNKNDPAYKWYGKRGVIVCDEWKTNFLNFYNWANNNGYDSGLSIDRIDNNGNYEPSNCKWTTMYEQSFNRRTTIYVNITAFGETKDIHVWENDPRCHATVSVMCRRLGAGWNPERVISEPTWNKNGQKSKTILSTLNN
jgi:hypothetical protein